ncbi:MAG: A/G-specific adenine glycosylase [candidate division KSB1 bacterium]|nr:A/G-specific adenine glycosylase [candidate division KSB1 bacterium]
MKTQPGKATVQTFQNQLIEWYQDEFRDLPWRQTSDPYRIWISEIMLQQTQVKTVIPYYERFIKRFPTVFDLANADLADLLKMWEGLGYYARARNMKKAAQVIVDQHQGVFPHTLKAVRALPGIGPYTAAAILSIAFDQDLAVVDGNVNRVLCRVFRINTDPKSTEGKKIMHKLAEQLLVRGRAGTCNQALMELGALICTPRSPQCLLCPVSELCKARQYGEQEKFPVKSPKRERPHYHIAAGLVWRNGTLLIDQRKEAAMLGGLWEFPGGKIKPGESPERAAEREVMEELGVTVQAEDLFTTIEHGYTHFGHSACIQLPLPDR